MTDRHHVRDITRWVLVAMLGALTAGGLGAPGAQAQGRPEGQPGATGLTADQRALRDAVAEAFDVVPLPDGLGLTPDDADDVGLVEIRAGAIAIDGEPVTGQELRDRIDDDADLVLRLSYVDPQTQRAMFGAETSDVPAVAAPPSPPAMPVPPSPPTPAPREGRTRRTTRSDVVRFGGLVTVDVDERVRGDVVVIGGRAVIDGEVTGDVVVVGGSARFGPEAIVHREVTVVGGGIERAPTAEFGRGITEVGIGNLPSGVWRGFPGPGRWFGPWQFDAWNLAGTVVRLIFLALIACVVAFAARGPVERVAERSAAEPLKAGLVGFLVQILIVPMLVVAILLLVISIIGIPLLLLLPFVLIGVLIAMLVGFTGAIQALGRWLGGRLGREDQSVYLSVWIGVALLLIPTMAGEMLRLAGGFLGVFALAFALAGTLLEYVAWTAGLGALVLNRFGGPVPSADGGASPQPNLPATPPIPPVGENPAPAQPV